MNTHPKVSIFLQLFVVILLMCSTVPAFADSTPPVNEELCPFLGGALVDTDGAHNLYVAAIDLYGNKSEVISTSFQIDATPPEITCPQAGPFLLDSGEQTVGPAGIEASISGLDEAASSLSGTISTGSVGPQSLTYTAYDLAGNSASQTCGYDVIYDFGGFYPPVAPAPSFNPVAAGSAIPLKFSLAGDQGLDVVASDFPTSQQIDCQTLAPAGDPLATRPVGKSGLSYDDQAGWYNYGWKTDKNGAGTCRALTIQLVDGTEHLLYFLLK